MPGIPHGGRLLEARRNYPDAPAPFIDLSTGINPVPYPFDPPTPETWQRLPEPETLRKLERAAATAYRAPDPAMVVAAPGTQALIQLLPLLFPRPAIAILGPTYAEHAATWQAAGTRVEQVTQLAPPAFVLCNPNNPDGARHDPAALATAATTKDLLIVDESFADFEPGLSLAPFLPLPRTIILRSFGKTYGLAGLRLGFALAEPTLAARIRQALGPWAISGPALAIGIQALTDHDYLEQEKRQTQAAAARLDLLLEAHGLRVLGGTTLFRLAASPDAPIIAERLAQAGLLVRTFPSHPTWLRFGLPPNEQAWSRLAKALTTPSTRRVGFSPPTP